MPVFAYKGVDSRGKAVTGAKDADSPKNLRAVLRRDGIIVTDCSEARGGKAGVASSGKGLRREVNLGGLLQTVKRAEIAAFTRQMATLLKAGIPLSEALGAIFEQLDNPKLKTIVGEVRTRVNEGTSLADALGKHGRVFEAVYLSMVRAGETAGNLDQVLARLADFMDAQGRVRAKVAGAMVYPILMSIVAGVVMTILMIVVIPQIKQIYADSEKSLPWNTTLLIFVAGMVGGYWYLFIPGSVGLTILFFAWKRSPSGKPHWDRFKLKLPIVGALARQIAIGRFARTFGTMLASGVALLRALDVSKDILGNAVLVKTIENAREQIQQGESIAVTLKKSGHFPSVVTHMIAVGERAGQLEQMLSNIADVYDQEVESKLARLTTLLEPIMIVVMGGAVAFIVFSILMPIMDLNPTMGGG